MIIEAEIARPAIGLIIGMSVARALDKPVYWIAVILSIVIFICVWRLEIAVSNYRSQD